MDNHVVNLSWSDIIKIASGVDSEGIPRSTGAIGIDQIINKQETIPITEHFLKDSVLNIYISGGAAIITIDFPYMALSLYKQCKATSENWLKDMKRDIDKQFTLSVIPYALTGQIIIFFNQLMFVDGYEHTDQAHRKTHRLILGFDNEATLTMETEQLDYMKIQQQITEELKQYEKEIEEELNEAIEEEKKAKKEENLFDMEMQKNINNPLALYEKNKKKEDSDNLRFSSEEQMHRFVDEDEEV